MYDTIKAYYQGELANIESMPKPEYFVENITASGDFIGYKAKFRNLYVYLSLYSKITIEGSLSRFVFGENFSTMSRASTEEAVEEIVAFTGIPAEQWVITRLDISTILPTSTAIKTLQSILGSVSRCKRWESGKNGIYWGNEQRQLVLYDKTKWAEVTKTPLPEVLKGGEWIRAELRLMKDIRGQTKSDANLSLLYDEDFYLRVCQLWQFKFLSIKKQSGGIFQKKTPTAKEALGQFVAMLQSADKELFERVEKQASVNCEKVAERSRFRQNLKKMLEKHNEPNDVADAVYKTFQNLIKFGIASH